VGSGCHAYTRSIVWEGVRHCPRWGLLAIVLAASAVCAAAVPSAGHAAPPANDAFATPEVLPAALPQDVTGDNTGATAEPNEPNHGTYAPETTVWFSWTPAESGYANIKMCGYEAHPENGLKPNAVYTGDTLTNLHRIVSSDADAACSHTFAITAGTTYRIAVDSYFGNTSGPFTFNLRAAIPPANDNFNAAQAIGPNMPISFDSGVGDATAEPGEPGWEPYRTVWYRWSNPTNRVAYPTVDVCHNSYVARLGVYVGNSLDSLVPVEQGPDSSSCHIIFRADPGVVYRIVVDSDPGISDGLDAITFTLTLDGPLAPANDSFAAAQAVGPSLPLSANGTTVLATDELGEPDHAGLEPFWSVWYSWTSPDNGPVVVDTCAATFDSVLAVYTGSSVAALTPVAANDDGEDYCEAAGGSSAGSAARFYAMTDTTYRIAIDAWDDTGPGDFTLSIRATGPHTQPGSAPIASPAPTKHCHKGKKLKKGKCVKKKPKKRKR
jgi:hypothetical protein